MWPIFFKSKMASKSKMAAIKKIGKRFQTIEGCTKNKVHCKLQKSCEVGVRHTLKGKATVKHV